MFVVRRSEHNPILAPAAANPWEAYSAFNGSPIYVGKATHILYRAMSIPEKFENSSFSLSTIGHAVSEDGFHFRNRRQFITPEHSWERYGCEDPRVTKLKGKYYIFYTALAHYPFNADNIKVAVAISKDMKTVTEKHLVTPFNAKAMVLFPEKVKGKFTAILAVNTDRPPSKIAIAQFDKEEDMWSEDFWNKWYKDLDQHVIELKRESGDQVEVGAPPIKTKGGWLVIYSHIQNYGSGNVIFGIEAVLLDLKNPLKIVGRTHGPILVPEESYEKYGVAPNIAFPSGALIDGKILHIYYGGADTTCAVASVHLAHLIRSMRGMNSKVIVRASKNPIISPNNNAWEKKATFNPAAIALGGKIHILYRAMSDDNTSRFGYAFTTDGVKIKYRYDKPVYGPREDFERKGVPNGNSGCEDPRLTQIGDRIYMCYTAFNGLESPAVAMTHISASDFESMQWKWSKPVLLSPEGVDDKDACIVPIERQGMQLLFHRIDNAICATYIDINNPTRKTERTVVLKSRPMMWDSNKVGISVPPIWTKHGWLLIYHGVSDKGVYRVGLALLDEQNPMHVIAQTTDFILEPVMPYEKNGQVGNVVFPCGAVLKRGIVYIYYGGGDSVICVAYAKLSDLLDILLT